MGTGPNGTSGTELGQHPYSVSARRKAYWFVYCDSDNKDIPIHRVQIGAFQVSQ